MKQRLLIQKQGRTQTPTSNLDEEKNENMIQSQSPQDFSE